ncbi:MAG TPA: NfeD family protein [Dehalococcoidales bacterium]
MAWWLLALLIILVGGFITLAVYLTIRTYHRQVITGKEDLKGKIAEVKETLDPEGEVIYQGDLWTARSISGKIEAGEEVIITEVQGLKVIVKKIEKE